MVGVVERARASPERAWLGGVFAAAVAIAAAAVAFPRAVYDRFIWKYFWGPVYADAHAARCAWLTDGGPELGRSAGTCMAAPETVAYPGYTVVSEVGYVLVVVVAIGGLALLLRRLGIRRYRGLFYGLFPIMLFGGALRVVEDANDRVVESAADQFVTYPLNTLFISPLIYVTVAAVALGALLVALRLERTGRVERFEYPLAAVGSLATLSTLGLLGWMAATTDAVQFYPVVLLVTLGVAAVSVAVVWVGIERLAPRLNAGTERMGLLVLVGQAVDGAANVVGLELYASLVPEVGENLVPKHPVNAAVVDLFGTAWPFLGLKLVAAVFIVWVFEESILEESPRFSVMLLVGAVAVGLGPGTRDMLRATFGV